MNTETTKPTDPNARFLVLSYKIESTTYEVYLLNPRDHFHLFGGSRSGLVVGKTASLIIRRKDTGWHDTEYKVNDPEAWAAVHRGILMSAGMSYEESVRRIPLGVKE